MESRWEAFPVISNVEVGRESLTKLSSMPKLHGCELPFHSTLLLASNECTRKIILSSIPKNNNQQILHRQEWFYSCQDPLLSSLRLQAVSLLCALIPRAICNTEQICPISFHVLFPQPPFLCFLFNSSGGLWPQCPCLRLSHMLPLYLVPGGATPHPSPSKSSAYHSFEKGGHKYSGDYHLSDQPSVERYFEGISRRHSFSSQN